MVPSLPVNVSGITGLASYADQATGGWLWIMMIIVSIVISFTWQNQYGWRGITVSLFFGTILTLLLTFAGFVEGRVLVVMIILLAAAGLIMYNVDE